MSNTDDYDVDARLCCDCVEDQFLRQQIRDKGAEVECSFCGEVGQTFLLGQIANLVEKAFNDHFERTSAEPSDSERFLIDDSDDLFWSREGERLPSVISDIAGIDENIAEAITGILADRHADQELAEMGEESEFAPDSHYLRKNHLDHNRHHGEWLEFEHRLQTECRFLSRSSQGILDEVFEGIDGFTTRDGNPAVQMIGAGTETTALFRARVFQSYDGLAKGLGRPDLEIGPPPAGQATAGRMNARGISVFYGAVTPETAMAEVRPPVGSDVVVAKFEILRPLRALNIAALKQILVHKSYFDPDYRPLLERAAFLSRLSDQMTRPVMPEREHADYLVTQVIADYLASEHRLDGMIYPSVQVQSGINVVLFHRACRTEEIGIPKGTVTGLAERCADEDGENTYYEVIEEPPSVSDIESPKNIDASFDLFDSTPIEIPRGLSSQREMSLRIFINEIEVRRVTAVEFSSRTSSVCRWRMPDPDADYEAIW